LALREALATALLLAAVPVPGGETITLRGRVVDARSGESVPDARVRVSEGRREASSRHPFLGLGEVEFRDDRGAGHEPGVEA